MNDTQAGARLLPCPFCGSEPLMWGDSSTRVTCSNDQCAGNTSMPTPFNGWGHRADAIAAWNRRAAQAVPRNVSSDEAGGHVKCLRTLRQWPMLANVAATAAALDAAICALTRPSAAPASEARERLYALANHFDATVGSLPDEWQDFADEVSREMRCVVLMLAATPKPAAETGSTGADEAMRRFVLSADLYGLLTDIQNGIDSPATCGMANSLIVRLDRLRDSIATPTQDAAHGGRDE
jgi:hypothetical protein